MTQVRHVVGAVSVHDDKAFVIRRPADRRLFLGCWDLPGGHVEEGESLHEALGREIEEETGWRLQAVLADLGMHRWVGNDGQERIEHDHLVAAEGDLSRPRLELAKHPEHRCVDPTDLELLAENRVPDRTSCSG